MSCYIHEDASITCNIQLQLKMYTRKETIIVYDVVEAHIYIRLANHIIRISYYLIPYLIWPAFIIILHKTAKCHHEVPDVLLREPCRHTIQ